MAFSSGKGLRKPYSGRRTPSLLILFGCGYAALGRARDILERLLEQELKHFGELGDALRSSEFCSDSNGGAPSLDVDVEIRHSASHEGKPVEAGQQASLWPPRIDATPLWRTGSIDRWAGRSGCRKRVSKVRL
jgi:hypothetical protein